MRASAPALPPQGSPASQAAISGCPGSAGSWAAVEPGAADAARAQRFGQRVEIDDRAARRVDHDQPGLRFGEEAVADQAAGLLQRRVHAKDVGARHHLVEGSAPARSPPRARCRSTDRIVEGHLHVEGRRPPRRRKPDPTQPEHRKGAPRSRRISGAVA